MSAEPVAVAEVYRAHYGGRTRNVGFNSVRLLVSGDCVAPGDKLFTRATLDAAVAAARAGEREPLAEGEVFKILVQLMPDAVRLPPGFLDFARAIERAHGITKETTK